MSFLLDTNVLSEMRKGERADRNVRSWLRHSSGASFFLSVLVLGEIRRGIEKQRRKDPVAASALEHWLGRVVESHGSRIIPVDHRVADLWGRLGSPDPIPVIDGLLAATAIVHDLTLVTRNLTDIRETGASFLNPFEYRS